MANKHPAAGAAPQENKMGVMPIGKLLAVCAAVGLLAAWNLLFVDAILLRWGVCAVAVIPVSLYLLGQMRKEKASL